MRWISLTRDDGRPTFVGELLDRRLALELLRHLALHPHHPVDRLDHVHGDADRPGLVGDRSSDGLADPPGRVRRELEALHVVELLDRPHQAEVALLDEVEEEHPPAHVALRDRHDEPQVRLDQLGLRVLAVDDVAPEPAFVHEVALGEAVLRDHPGLDPLRELHLFGAGQQPDSTDLLEVHPHGIGRRADRTRGIPVEQRRAQPSWRHHLVFDGFDLFARATRIGDRGLERDGREDLAVIELFDTARRV